jgi:hypothetical protein
VRPPPDVCVAVPVMTGTVAVPVVLTVPVLEMDACVAEDFVETVLLPVAAVLAVVVPAGAAALVDTDADETAAGVLEELT